MFPLRTILFALVVIGITTAAASAATFFTAELTHDQETTTGTLLTSSGAPRPLSFGTAEFVLNDAMTEFTFTATIFNIDVTGAQTPNDTNDNLVNAHIHAPAPPGMNAGVVWGFFGSPFNNTAPDDGVVTPFAVGVGGTFSGTWNATEGNSTTLAAQLPNIFANLSYINFHTTQFPGGEIRGQILVPEPHTLAVLALGAMIVLGRRSPGRRRCDG